MLNLWLVSPAWRRLDVTRLALAERRWLCDELTSRGLTARGVIVADDENLDLAAEYGFHGLEFPNDRGLGAKFNAGYRYALERGADYVVHIGSDDWVHPDFLDPLPIPDVGQGQKPMPSPLGTIVQTAGPVMLCARRIALVHLQSGQGVVFPSRRMWGNVPWAIPRSAFAGKPEPIEPQLPRGMEHALVRGLGPLNYRHHDPHPFLGVDFKSEVNVTPWETLVSHAEPRPDIWRELAEHYPAHLVEQARAFQVSEVAA